MFLAASPVSTLEDRTVSSLTASESDRALEQLWKDPNAKVDDFARSFKQLRQGLVTGVLQYDITVVSKISRQVGIIGISSGLITSILPSCLS